MPNALLNPGPLPSFSHIKLEDIEPAIQETIKDNRQKLKTLLQQKEMTWKTIMEPLEEMNDRLAKIWSPISHLRSVCETEALRKIYQECLSSLTEYHTALMQNEELYRAVRSIADGPEYSTLDFAQQKVIDNELRDFHLAGVDLSPEKKLRFAELQKQLTQLSTQFSENVLDATHAWSLNITSEKDLSGLPESNLQIAKENANQRNQSGWMLTLDFPCYSAVMKYVSNRDLRKVMYEAYVTRASDQGPDAGKWNNSAIIDEILSKRFELAALLGFKNFAEVSLSTKMAKTPDRVLTFLLDLVSRSKRQGEKEILEVKEYAKKNDNIDPLQAWDIAYYTEKLRQKTYDLSQEELRSYFPAPKVLSGMFSVVNKLFGINIIERKDVDTWHPSVQFFEIFDSSGQLRGGFYTDLYARPHKKDGAWMDEARVRRQLANGAMQIPIAYLTCNFTRPVDNKPSYLTHDEVETLFHEFGHCLHHLMTKINYASVSGINGVPWDAVEFPSQFLENWCWDKETLKFISEHKETKETLPDDLFEKLISAKNFQSGMHLLRQLEFALFDFRLHLEYEKDKSSDVQAILNDVRKQVSVFSTPSFNRFQNSFSHIFSGGYAAGYYSYAWAQVLAADAFSRFEEEGLLNENVGRDFLHFILEKGGAQDPMKLFMAFRGREPKIEPLLKQNGLI